jgi:hypothetical protein
MKRIMTLILVLLVVMAASAVYAQDDDQLAPIIMQGDSAYTNTFEDANAHLYAFSGAAGDSVTIRMVQDPNSTLDPYLVLMGPGGQVYTADDDGGEALLSAQITDFVLPEDGFYFILATSSDGLREGPDDNYEPQDYELALIGGTSLEDPANIELVEYEAVEVSPGDTVSLELTQEQPVLYLNLFAEEDTVLTIRTGELGEFTDTLLYLFDDEGERVAVVDDVGDSRYAVIEDFEVPETGLYLIFATNFDYFRAIEGDWPGAGSTFTLSVEQ